MGFEVRLVPPIYVKPFVKRHKNEAAEAVCEAASRPGMQLVASESAEQQGEAMLFRTRDLLIRQRNQTVNALRGHLAEHGVVAPQGIANAARLAAAVDDPEAQLPETVRDLGRELLEQIDILDAKTGKLDAEVRKRAKESDEAKRLTGIPGIAPICAMAIQAFAPPMEGFRRRRDFSAWFPDSARQGESRSSAGSRRWGNATSGGCSLLGRSRSSAGRFGAEPTPRPHWRTRWRGWSGPSRRRRNPTELPRPPERRRPGPRERMRT